VPIEGQLLKPILERVGVPSFALDVRGRVSWLNGAAIDFVGDIRGRPFTIAVAPHDTSRLRRQFAQKLAEGSASAFEATLITRNGGLASCGLSSTALHRDGLVVGVFGVMTRPPVEERPLPVRPERLTPRQYEVLQLVAAGAGTDEIAGLLRLSRETVRNHVRAVMRRLEAKNRLEAVAIARRDALVLH
jgi:DNA-binding CsgD family transcriptional regulator